MISGRRSATVAVFSSVLLAGIVPAAPSAHQPQGRPRIAGPYGSGSAQVWIMRAVGETRSVVVFGHGWKSAPPSPARPWVRQFLPWLEHLARNGSAVVFPRYQFGLRDAADAHRTDDFRSGIAVGLGRLGSPDVPVVAAGYSFGASLALAYAANASRWGLPVPAAVDAVFPAGPVPGVPLPRLAPTARVLIQVGDEDTVAGTWGARAFWRWLGGRRTATRNYVVVRSDGTFRATHAAPKLSSVEARRAFWQPLDRLLAQVRRR